MAYALKILATYMYEGRDGPREGEGYPRGVTPSG